MVGRKAGTIRDYTGTAGRCHAPRELAVAVVAWLTHPEKQVPGQRMGYRLEKAMDGEDIVAFLTAKGKEHIRQKLK